MRGSTLWLQGDRLPVGRLRLFGLPPLRVQAPTARKRRSDSPERGCWLERALAGAPTLTGAARNVTDPGDLNRVPAPPQWPGSSRGGRANLSAGISLRALAASARRTVAGEEAERATERLRCLLNLALAQAAPGGGECGVCRHQCPILAGRVLRLTGGIEDGSRTEASRDRIAPLQRSPQSTGRVSVVAGSGQDHAEVITIRWVLPDSGGPPVGRHWRRRPTGCEPATPMLRCPTP